MEVDDALCIVSELCHGGSLLDYLTIKGRITEEAVVKALVRQLAEAVLYLHSEANIVHRDLKLENVMILEDWKSMGSGSLDKLGNEFVPTLKICDFGLSDFIHGDIAEEDEDEDEDAFDKVLPSSPACSSTASFGVGSLHYCSPEDLRGTVTSANGESSDVWALGCIIYALVTGGLPFNDGFLPRLQQSIMQGGYDAERLERCGCSDEVKSLIKGIFEVDVGKRVSLKELLNGPWLRE
ncbi:kinase-like protein [Rhizoclosmatium globosum]|uniref:Kinase-like protein n=1 Tax=Rhizoclosmatium globosum TaxID=329046 RepID=A0A1Y2CFG5_9FUNG|nr:kinase-like protein [Rhizoclosmatium globosum]|eukprot:ORY45762.1 kinase-like protein [Rhizoclosmatium globosum]